MKPEYHEGPKARETFDKGMATLSDSKGNREREAQPKRKRKKASKD